MQISSWGPFGKIYSQIISRNNILLVLNMQTPLAFWPWSTQQASPVSLIYLTLMIQLYMFAD